VLGELRAAWDALADPAEFAGMLAQSGLSRAELFALLGAALTKTISLPALRWAPGPGSPKLGAG
jgi:putative heme degradation protein